METHEDTSGANTYVQPTRSWFVNYAAYLVDVNRGRARNIDLDFEDLAGVVSYGEHHRLPGEAIQYAERKLREFAAAGLGDSARFLAEAVQIRKQIRQQRARKLEG
jgi:hypothetical protein